MKSSDALLFSLKASRANLPAAAAIAIGLSLALGVVYTETADELLAYLLIALACAIPIAIWVWRGAPGIPVLPAVAAMFLLYYGVPIIRRNSTLWYAPSEILVGAVTVAVYLFAATVTWCLLAGSARRADDRGSTLISGQWLDRILFCGLVAGILFHTAVYSGVQTLLGPFFGVLRSAMLSFAISACFMTGHARALGRLRGQKWALAVACLSTLILLSWMSLFLIGGLLYCLAAVLGYFITAKRVPWWFLTGALAVVIVFHAGKDHMREKYWPTGANYNANVTAYDMPGIMEEWVVTGVRTILYGEDYASAVDRASLFGLLLEVQRLVPDYVPYLNGASYALLPEMLVPRFLDPDKIPSQAAMSMLNIGVGFQTAEGTATTAIGWGLVAEAYYNFGYLGVVGVGLLFGCFCGFIERWTIGAAMFSLPTLIAVAALMQIIGMELDAAGLVTALFQSFASVALVFLFIKILINKKRTLKGQFAGSQRIA